MELNEKLYSTELAFVWKKQQGCKLKEITNLVKEGCNNNESRNVRDLINTTREMNFC